MLMISLYRECILSLMDFLGIDIIVLIWPRYFLAGLV